MSPSLWSIIVLLASTKITFNLIKHYMKMFLIVRHCTSVDILLEAILFLHRGTVGVLLLYCIVYKHVYYYH